MRRPAAETTTPGWTCSTCMSAHLYKLRLTQDLAWLDRVVRVVLAQTMQSTYSDAAQPTARSKRKTAGARRRPTLATVLTRRLDIELFGITRYVRELPQLPSRTDGDQRDKR